VDEQAERRAARNEDLFRETNEAIERGMWPSAPETLVRFRCECSTIDCGQAVEVSLRDYERVRQSPRRFILAYGHVTPEIEMIVERAVRYVIVEKEGLAGAVAGATDPRS
jgi:hypothetical protein